MTHAQAVKLLNQHRHGIPLCHTIAVCNALLVEAMELLEKDRRLLKAAHVHPDAPDAPDVEAL